MTKMLETEYGSVAADWKFIPSSEFCIRITDGTHDSPKEQKEGKHLITSKHIKGREIDFDTAYLIKEEDFNKINLRSKVDQWDVIISMIGEYCGFCYVEKNNTIDYAVKNVGILKTGKKEKAFWLYYYLSSRIGKFILDANKSGTSQPYLTLGFLRDFPVLYPNNDKEAENINEILSSLDDKIDLLHRQNKTLEQLAETLFSETLKVNSKKMEDKPLSYLIATTLGGEWGKENIEGEFTKQVCCIRGTDIADLQEGLANRTPIRFVKEKKFENIQPLDGDLILEISGGTDDQSTGRTIYINELNRKLFPHPLIFSNFCRLIRPVKKEYSYFLYLYIQYLYKKDEFFNLENGSSGIKNLDYKYLLNDLKFLLPNSEGEILKFNDEVKIYFKKINKNKHQIRTLTQLRDTLLPKLMSGEVRVEL